MASEYYEEKLQYGLPRSPSSHRSPRNPEDRDFFKKRFSIISENKSVRSVGSEEEYLGRRDHIFQNMNLQKEQDAAILSAMSQEREYEDPDSNWSQGSVHRIRKASFRKRAPKQIAMTINAHTDSHGSNASISPRGNGKRPKSPQSPKSPPRPPGMTRLQRNSSGHKRQSSISLDISSNASDADVNDENDVNGVHHINDHEPDKSLKSVKKQDIKKEDQNYMDIYSDFEYEKFRPSCCLHLIVFVLLTAVCGAIFYYFYFYDRLNYWDDC